MHLRLEQDINAPAEAVWQVLGTEFADIATWSTFVKTSRALDQNEVPASITVAPTAPVPGRETMTKVKLTEILTAYSDEDRSLTFDGAGLPKVVRRARDAQSVRPNGANTCTVVFEIDFDFVGPFAIFNPIVKNRMSKTFAEVLTDLKRFVESAN